MQYFARKTSYNLGYTKLMHKHGRLYTEKEKIYEFALSAFS